MANRPLEIGGRIFSSRLFIGTGKYPDFAVMEKAVEASGAEIVTVAVRRVKIDGSSDSLLAHLDKDKVLILPNTAGCTTADEAIRTARLAREAGLPPFVKLEVIGDAKTLFPDNEGLLEATRALVQEGFTVMPYTNDDLVVCKKLEQAGAACVMPLAAPIGSGLGMRNRHTLALLLDAITIPIIVDAGVGTASDAAKVMETGADGVLMNTAIACAKEPVGMARAMRLAVEAGRLAYESGRIPMRPYATASSPITGLID